MNDLIESDMPARWGARLAFAAALLWLVAAGVVVGIAVNLGFRIMPFDILTMAALAAGIAAPAGALLLLALVLQGGSRAEIEQLARQHARAGEHAGAIRAVLTDVDAMLGAVGARLDALRDIATNNADGLSVAATRLEASAAVLNVATDSANTAAHDLLASIPEAKGHTDAITAMLENTASEAARQLAEVETLLAGLWARGDDAQHQSESATTRLKTLLGDIDASATAAQASVAARHAQLESSVEGLFDRTTQALDTTRDSIHAQTNALLAAVDQARVALDQIGGEAARAIGGRLDRLLGAADKFGTQLGEQDVRSRTLVDTLERSFVMLDGKLQHSATMGQTTLDDLAGRIGTLRVAIDAISAPLAGTASAIGGLESQLGEVNMKTDKAINAIDATLPATRASLGQLADELDGLQRRTGDLAAPVAAGQAAIAAAAAAFVEQKAALDTGATQLAAQIEQASSMLSAIEAQATGSATGAANALIEVLARVREVSSASTGSMRATIENLITEAEIALERAGTDKVEQAFGAPVRAQIAAIQAASDAAAEAAQAAGDRVNRQLIGLTRTVAGVEGRVEAADARFEARSHNDMVARSAALLDQLGNASIDLTKQLATDIGDESWAAHLRGDKGFFARRAVKLLDRRSAGAVAELCRQNPNFRDDAVSYIATFQALIQRVLPERDGELLAVTLVSSDLGKLYVALSQAVERLR